MGARVSCSRRQRYQAQDGSADARADHHDRESAVSCTATPTTRRTRPGRRPPPSGPRRRGRSCSGATPSSVAAHSRRPSQPPWRGSCWSADRRPRCRRRPARFPRCGRCPDRRCRPRRGRRRRPGRGSCRRSRRRGTARWRCRREQILAAGPDAVGVLGHGEDVHGRVGRAEALVVGRLQHAAARADHDAGARRWRCRARPTVARQIDVVDRARRGVDPQTWFELPRAREPDQAVLAGEVDRAEVVGHVRLARHDVVDRLRAASGRPDRRRTRRRRGHPDAAGAERHVAHVVLVGQRPHGKARSAMTAYRLAGAGVVADRQGDPVVARQDGRRAGSRCRCPRRR